MFFPIFILCLSHLVLASPVQREYDVEDIQQLKYNFNDFNVKYNRTYTAEEERLRFHYFKENLAHINELNRKNPLAVYGINKFADWSAKEMQSLFGFDSANLGDDDLGLCTAGVASDIQTGPLPDTLDWRDKNAVAPVQDQHQCGACWAFSSASVIEGAYALKHNTLLKVSEQQFVDCDKKGDGCKGGWPHLAITSSMQLGGQELEKDYPYKAEVQQCLFDVNKAQVKPTACKVFFGIGDQDDKLASLLASVGPLSIALDPHAFILYQAGIITQCESESDVDSVTLVGYGEEGGVPYWIVKNSWGTEWGENGYVRVKRGVGCLMMGDYVLTVEVA